MGVVARFQGGLHQAPRYRTYYSSREASNPSKRFPLPSAFLFHAAQTFEVLILAYCCQNMPSDEKEKYRMQVNHPLIGYWHLLKVMWTVGSRTYYGRQMKLELWITLISCRVILPPADAFGHLSDQDVT